MPEEPMSITARYAAAQAIAAKAGRAAHDYFVRRASLAIEAKGAQDFVSHADRAIEALIRAEILLEFPGDAFLGEETAASFAGTDANLWVVDPIDGTHNFLRGSRYYCVSIAYVDRGQREIGVVCDPEHDEIFRARRGHGA
jgi:myo-inositol-1(or 4)-monophosphatase